MGHPRCIMRYFVSLFEGKGLIVKIMRRYSQILKKRSSRLFKLFVRYPIEAVGMLFFCGIFRVLTLDQASAVGGYIGRKIGPKLKVSWVARYNLMKAFPEKSTAEIDAIVVDMWDNIIRTFTEYPHLRYLSDHYDDRIEYVNYDRCVQMRDDKKAGVLFSAHIGNWEIGSLLGNKLGMPLHRIYRSANNPYVEWVFRYFRLKIPGDLVTKGASGFRKIVAEMKQGGHFALLIDQKMNEGILVDFFGFPVKTTPSLARLVLKYDYPALPIRIERLNGAHFRLTAQELLTIEKTGNTEKDVETYMTAANQIIEQWIREDPAQWLWVHKRWPDSKLMWKQLYKQRKLWKKGIKPPEVFALSQKKDSEDVIA